MNAEKDTLIELTPAQQNPGQARGEDFQVEVYPSPSATVAVGGLACQRGETEREHRQLLGQAEHYTGHAAPLAPSTAGPRAA
jgi:hypothetical protein